MTNWTFTKHALSRALDMLVTPEEIRACLDSPEIAYRQKDRPEGYGVRQAGRIGLAVDYNRGIVLSVLHREEAHYSRSDVAHTVRLAS
ncbi:hypothetical protein [Streptosporangium sp. OZ121]|uniref:hypothetical protein n=1 Tax=Streptosporangium sp. OZ121 TaxID=3444183 RepID=UPI003F78E02C